MKNLSLCLRILIACWAFPSFIIYFSSLATKRIYRFPGAEICRMIFSALFPTSALMMHSNILLTFMLTTAIHWVSISSAWARIIHLNASLNLKLYLSANEPHHLSHLPSCICTFVLPVTQSRNLRLIFDSLLTSCHQIYPFFWVPSKLILFLPLLLLEPQFIHHSFIQKAI